MSDALTREAEATLLELGWLILSHVAPPEDYHHLAELGRKVKALTNRLRAVKRGDDRYEKERTRLSLDPDRFPRSEDELLREVTE